jgi:hypothetical protein
MQPPSFIAFTGVDRLDLLPGMRLLSARYPIEWGVLVDPDQEDKPLFPNTATRTTLLAEPGLRWAAHICGASAREIVATPRATAVAVTGVQRVQVNHSFQGSAPDQIAAARDYGRRLGVRTVLQCAGAFPTETGVDWLYDVSFGTGIKPKTGPPCPPPVPSAAIPAESAPRRSSRSWVASMRPMARSTGSTWSRASARTAPSTWPSAKPFAARSMDEPSLAEAGHPRHRSGR